MTKEEIENIVEIRLLTERMNNHFTLEEIEFRTKELMLEYAFERSEFVQRLLDLTKVIITHFALIVYAQLTNSNQENINHWREELAGWIQEFQGMDTKPKKGNRKLVERALMSTWVDKSELPTRPDIVFGKYKNKFREEGIVLTDEIKEIIFSTFVNNISLIVKEMAYGTEQTTLQYVNNIQIG